VKGKFRENKAFSGKGATHHILLPPNLSVDFDRRLAPVVAVLGGESNHIWANEEENLENCRKT
jgi:hypothetical protein